MADSNQSSTSTQAAAQSVASKVTSGGQNATTPNPATVANSPGNVSGGNVNITLPPALTNGGAKK
jgi:hypothetical protein